MYIKLVNYKNFNSSNTYSDTTLAIDMLIELRSKASQYKSDGLGHGEAYFNAEQNAIVAKKCRDILPQNDTRWHCYMEYT
jgi:hypothetical protein